MKRYIPFALLAGLILWAYQALLVPSGLPFTHDSQMHIARMVNFYLAAKQGQLPPRWAPVLNNWFGYPVFNFNYPLPYLLSLPLIVGRYTGEQALFLITLSSLLSGAFGIWTLTRSVFGKLGSFVAAVLYVCNPYQIILVFVRGTIGETLCFALLPWLLWLIRRVIVEKSFKRWNQLALVLIGAAYLLAHNIIVLFSLPILFLWVIWLCRTSIRRYVRVLIPGCLSLMLSLWFWVPALFEKQFTILDSAALSRDYSYHFPSLNQLLHGAFGYGYSMAGPVDGMSFHLGTIQVLLFSVAGLLILVKSRQRHVAALAIFGGALVSIIAMLPISLPLWQKLPLLSYIQFPWRLLFFWTVFVSLLGGWVVRETRRATWLWVLVIVALLITTRAVGKPYMSFHFPPDYWLNYSETTSIADENMPALFNKERAYALVHTLFRDKNVAPTSQGPQITVDSWTGSRHVYRINSYITTRVVERTAYFPGWEVRVDGELVDIDETIPQYLGLVTFNVPSGEHTVVSEFTQHTIARVWGNWLSMVGLIGLAVWLKYGKKVE